MKRKRSKRKRRVPVAFHRITTPKFTKDVDELRTYGRRRGRYVQDGRVRLSSSRVMDIRAVLSGNAIKDMLTEKDNLWLAEMTRAT